MTYEFCSFTASEKELPKFSGSTFVMLPIFEATSNVDDERRPERHRRRRRRHRHRSGKRRLAEPVGHFRDRRNRGRTPAAASWSTGRCCRNRHCRCCRCCRQQRHWDDRDDNIWDSTKVGLTSLFQKVKFNSKLVRFKKSTKNFI